MKNNKKIGVSKLFILAFLGLIAGFGIGFIFNKLNIGGLTEIINTFLSENALLLSIVINTLWAILAIYFYTRAKKEVELGLEKDDFIETKYIDYAHSMRDAGLFTLLSFIIILYNRVKFSHNPLKDGIILTSVLIIFTFINVFLFYLTYKLTKKIEPERKTEVFDFFFESKFMSESDERDKVKYYKKGYLAYKRMLMSQFVIIIILFCSALYENISPIIALIVLIPSLIGVLTNGFAGEKND
ncbi:DUF3169 family protein [uncultured Anaerococcus sp.]|uniref:DUF3169 family protein n=1 Tax=uncultured Anaerococcus sp. TaxID=293428 RepID=UPI00288A3024|nr:DUF3169 family protein [uncultured Anaerococcus sp.]